MFQDRLLNVMCSFSNTTPGKLLQIPPGEVLIISYDMRLELPVIVNEIDNKKDG